MFLLNQKLVHNRKYCECEKKIFIHSCYQFRKTGDNGSNIVFFFMILVYNTNSFCEICYNIKKKRNSKVLRF